MTPDATPDPVATTPAGGGIGVSGWASILTGTTGLAAAVQSFPWNGAVAVSGVFASMLIQSVKLLTDAEKRSLKDRLNFALLSAKAADEREREARQEAARQRDADRARIADLVKQLDAEKARVDAANARADRMLTVALEHANEMGTDVHKTLADAGKPTPVHAPEPTPTPTPPVPTPAPLPPEPTGSDFTLTDPPVQPSDDTPPAVS